MYCGKCGKEIREGNTFCTACGEKIDATNHEGGLSNASIAGVGAAVNSCESPGNAYLDKIIKNCNFNDSRFFDVASIRKTNKKHALRALSYYGVEESYLSKDHIVIPRVMCYDLECADFAPAFVTLYDEAILFFKLDADGRLKSTNISHGEWEVTLLRMVSVSDNRHVLVKFAEEIIIIEEQSWRKLVNFANINGIFVEEQDNEGKDDIGNNAPWVSSDLNIGESADFKLLKIEMLSLEDARFIWVNLYLTIDRETEKTHCTIEKFSKAGRYQSKTCSSMKTLSPSFDIVKELDNGKWIVLFGDDTELVLTTQESMSLCDFIQS